MEEQQSTPKTAAETEALYAELSKKLTVLFHLHCLEYEDDETDDNEVIETGQ